MALSPIAGSTTTDKVRAVQRVKTLAPSKTYEYDFDRQEFTGQMVDEKAALEQFVRKALVTPRFRHLIYSAAYGSELDDTLGLDVTANYLNSEIPRLVREALIYDDRIADVNKFTVTKDPKTDKVFLTFSVTAVDGYIIEIEEVKI